MSLGLGMPLDDYIKASKNKERSGYVRNNNNSRRYKSGGNSSYNNRPQQRYNKPQNPGNFSGNRFKRNDDYENKTGGFNKVIATSFYKICSDFRKTIGNMIDSKDSLKKTKILRSKNLRDLPVPHK